MKAIKIRKVYKQQFLQAVSIMALDYEELRGVVTKDFVFFRIYTFSQDDIFKLGQHYSQLVQKAFSQEFNFHER